MLATLKRVISYLKKYGFYETLKKTVFDIKNIIKIKFYKITNKKIIKTPYGFYMSKNWSDANFEWIVCGLYSKNYHQYLNKIKYPFIFIDIGANLGMFSLSAAQNVYCNQVFSFEPVLNTYNELKLNMLINKFENKMVINNSGISNIVEKSKIFYDVYHSGSASIIHKVNKNSKVENISLLNHTELEKLIPTSNKIIVKIDVEGHEEIVINELLKCKFAKDVISILYECHTDWTNSDKINKKLLNRGFKNFKNIHTYKDKQYSKEDTFYDVFVSR